MNHDDRRVRRSRRLMGDALLNLLQTHELCAITVRAVTDTADVGYMTFYRHYDNLDDLLVDRIRSIIQEQIAQVIVECDRQGVLIFDHIAKSVALYKTLLFSHNAARARQKLEEMLTEFFLLTVKDDFLIPRDLRARQMAAGVLSLAGWWLEGGTVVTVEQMATMYNILIIDGNIDLEKMRALVFSGTC